MNSFFTSFIAIILLAVVAIAGLTFIDVDETQASARAPSIASSLSNLVESSAFFNESRGNYPLSFEDMQSEFDGLTAEGVDGQYFISNNIGCIGLDYTENNELTLQAAKLRLNGSVVSNSCGELESNGRRYLAISLDGQSLPVGDAFLASLTPEGIASAPPPAPPLERGQLPFTDLSQLCGVEPPLSANNIEKGRYISCYLTDFNQRARAWFLAGRGLTPSANELFEEGFISHPPPAYPELSSITVTRDPRFLGLLSRPSPTPYGSVAFFGNSSSSTTSQRNLSVQTASNSSEQTQSLLSGAHVYMPPFLFRDQFDQVDFTPYEPEGGVPDENSTLREQAQYIAYWISFNNQSARAWIASGNSPGGGNRFTFQQLEASGFPTIPIPNLGQGSSFSIRIPNQFNPDRRIFFQHTISSRLSHSRALCDLVDEYTYRLSFCGASGLFWRNFRVVGS